MIFAKKKIIGAFMDLIMHKYRVAIVISGALIIASILIFTGALQTSARQPEQIPTGSVPTVTGTPLGAFIVVRDNEQGFANVRSGPGTMGYEIVGVLVVGQKVPALGRSPGGDWIQIAYPGVPGGVAWIWIDLVDVSGGLSVVEPPPTPTPRVTATIDPTLAAQFLVEILPTRLPTFTPPQPAVIPTFPVEEPVGNTGGIPMALIIIGSAVLGLFGLLISLLRGR